MAKVQLIRPEDDEVKSAAPGELKKVTDLARLLFTKEEEVTRLSARLIELQKEITDIEMHRLPDLMQEIGMNEFSLTNGWEIAVKPFCRGSIPTQTAIDECDDEIEKKLLSDRRTKALAWLKKVNADSLIKNKLVAEFGKGQNEYAEKYFAMLRKTFPTTLEASVNFQTLNSFFRERLKDGKPIPEAPFALVIGKKAELKPPKKEKA